jgi:hypothetical protein
MKKTITIISFLLLFLIAVGMFGYGFYYVGRIIDDVNTNQFGDYDYIWTTAICDGNECRDFKVTCKDGNVLDLEPITGFVTFGENWQDKREVNASLCEE